MQICYCCIDNYYEIMILSLMYCYLIQKNYCHIETMILSLVYVSILVVLVHILH
jgi:hypothetical protein